MFEKKDKEPHIPGALDKLAMAKRMRETGRMETASDRVAGQPGSPLIPLTVIFVLASGFAMWLLDDSSMGRLHPTGAGNIDRLLVGASIPSLTGTPDTDRVIIVLIRGLALFMLAGLAPLFGFVTTRILGPHRMGPYVATTGAGMALLIIYYAVRDSLPSLLSGL